jgi:hypothetical protein
MHEVKSALLAAHWDTAAALEELQRRGQTAASKKARFGMARIPSFSPLCFSRRRGSQRRGWWVLPRARTLLGWWR